MNLKEIIEKNKNPNAYYEARLLKLLEEVEGVKREVKQVVKEAVQEIKEAKEDSVFKELQPTKELAERVVKQEIASFKGDITDQIKSILKTVETKEKTAYERLSNEIDKTGAFLEEKVVQFIEEYRGQMAEMSEEHHSALDGIVEKTKIAVGPKGEAGQAGRAGADGADGADGKDSNIFDITNLAMSKLAPKIEEKGAKIEEKLREEIELLKKMIRERKRDRGSSSGGGGMGNWTHETPSGSVNGVNTDFTTTYNVASSGKALIVLLNGQMQRLTTHYTVSGKTITFTTAPETGDVVFSTYVRT